MPDRKFRAVTVVGKVQTKGRHALGAGLGVGRAWVERVVLPRAPDDPAALSVVGFWTQEFSDHPEVQAFLEYHYSPARRWAASISVGRAWLQNSSERLRATELTVRIVWRP